MPKKNIDQEFTAAEVLVELQRSQGGRSQAEFARDLGISPQYLNNVYGGFRPRPESVLGKIGFREKVGVFCRVVGGKK